MGCGASSVEQSPIFAEPMMAGMMQGNMRSMMNGLMKVTVHNNDCTYQEVQDFMTPSSVNKPFLDKPGTFDPKMEGRVKESMMGRVALGRGSPTHLVAPELAILSKLHSEHTLNCNSLPVANSGV